MLQQYIDKYKGAHTFLSAERQSYGTQGRKAWFIEIECATCKSISFMRNDVALNSMTQCNNCSRKLKNVSHGLRHLRIYSVWAEMQARTTNVKHKKYARYGGRGIKVEFKDIVEFYEWAKLNGYKEIQPSLYKDYQSIDRKENDGNYSKDNCQWITVSANSTKKTGPYNV